MTNKEALDLLTRATAQVDVLAALAKDASQMLMEATTALYVMAAMNGEELPGMTENKELQ